jgi:hypothetical protein
MTRPVIALPLMVCLLALAAFPVLSSAQQPNDVGIFFNSAGTQNREFIPLFQTFKLYVVAFDPAEVGGVEMRIAPPPELLVLGVQLRGYPPICVTCPSLPDLYYGTSCLPGAPALELIEISAMMTTSADDVTVCTGPTTASSFDPPSPGYALCDGTTLIPLHPVANGGNGYPDGCAVINPTRAVATEAISWGSAKAKFQD